MVNLLAGSKLTTVDLSTTRPLELHLQVQHSGTTKRIAQYRSKAATEDTRPALPSRLRISASSHNRERTAVEGPLTSIDYLETHQGTKLVHYSSYQKTTTLSIVAYSCAES